MESDEIAPGSSLTGPGCWRRLESARALGLNIELPDSDNADPSYWERIHADGGYKPRIASQIADPWWHGDPNWVLLKGFPGSKFGSISGRA